MLGYLKFFISIVGKVIAGAGADICGYVWEALDEWEREGD